MADITALLSGTTLHIWWEFTEPKWSPPTDRAVENKGFLKKTDGSFAGAAVRALKVWPVGNYVGVVSDTEGDGTGLRKTVTLTEIPSS